MTLDQCPNVKKCVVVERTGNQVNWNEERDVSYKKLISSAPTKCDPEEMSAGIHCLFFTRQDQHKNQKEFTYNRWLYGLCLHDTSIYF